VKPNFRIITSALRGYGCFTVFLTEWYMASEYVTILWQLTLRPPYYPTSETPFHRTLRGPQKRCHVARTLRTRVRTPLWDWMFVHCVCVCRPTSPDVPMYVGQYSDWLRTGRWCSIPSRGRGLFPFRQHVQPVPGSHPVSYPMGTEDSFPGSKATRT